MVLGGPRRTHTVLGSGPGPLPAASPYPGAGVVVVSHISREFQVPFAGVSSRERRKPGHEHQRFVEGDTNLSLHGQGGKEQSWVPTIAAAFLRLASWGPPLGIGVPHSLPALVSIAGVQATPLLPHPFSMHHRFVGVLPHTAPAFASPALAGGVFHQQRTISGPGPQGPGDSKQ